MQKTLEVHSLCLEMETRQVRIYEKSSTMKLVNSTLSVIVAPRECKLYTSMNLWMWLPAFTLDRDISQ